MRASVFGDASFRWAIDQRSGAIGISLFTRSKTVSRWSTVASGPQCIVRP